jgi:hypothetical protein
VLHHVGFFRIPAVCFVSVVCCDRRSGLGRSGELGRIEKDGKFADVVCRARRYKGRMYGYGPAQSVKAKVLSGERSPSSTNTVHGWLSATSRGLASVRVLFLHEKPTGQLAILVCGRCGSYRPLRVRRRRPCYRVTQRFPRQTHCVRKALAQAHSRSGEALPSFF